MANYARRAIPKKKEPVKVKFYEHPLFLAIINIIPATVVGIMGINVQQNIANEQSLQNKISAQQQDSINKINQAEQRRFSKLQFDLAYRKSIADSIQGEVTASIGKNQLQISRQQLAIINNAKKAQILKSLRDFDRYLVRYDSLVNDIPFYRYLENNKLEATQKVLLLVESQLTNPIIQEDPAFYKAYFLEINKLKGVISTQDGSYDKSKLIRDPIIIRSVKIDDFINFYKFQRVYYQKLLFKYLNINSGYKILNQDNSINEW